MFRSGVSAIAQRRTPSTDILQGADDELGGHE
jgi:hypothetical protein